MNRENTRSMGAGPNLDGGTAQSVVDIAETDRLVPVLVKECTASPNVLAEGEALSLTPMR
jgi:hypothetical protein